MTHVAEQSLTGIPASPGVAFGPVWRFGRATGRAPRNRAGNEVPVAEREAERERAVAALAGAAEAVLAVAGSLTPEEAEIVDTSALMAQDPILIAQVQDAVVASGLTADEAILMATGRHAEAIAALPDETLAVRADDVRSIGRRAARLASGEVHGRPPREDVILLADDLGPADVAEFAPWLAGIAVAGGSATAHAAIVARSLGLPMVAGLSATVLEIGDGEPVVVDGAGGIVVVAPMGERVDRAQEDMRARRRAVGRDHDLREQPALTREGTRVIVRTNVAGANDLAVGLSAGAEGIGLLRTELAFLDAADWPTEQNHTAAMDSILAGLGGLPAIVRVLDFGADKAPPFLRTVPERGLELLLSHPNAFMSQLRAILLAAQGRDVRILLPMVESAQQIDATRTLIEHAASALGLGDVPPLGAMIETPAAVQAADAIAARCEFLSIGTNDLTATTLGADRFAANSARAHHPLVLRSIARSALAAHRSRISVEVCGEAASDPVMLPLLVGLGLDELSVGAARVGQVRDWIRRLSDAQTVPLAHSALSMDSAEAVESAVQPLAAELLGEAGESSRKSGHRGDRVLARGA